MNNLTPEYLRSPIPSLKPYLFGYRSTNVLHTISCRTVKYRNSFYPDSVISWNNIGPELRRAKSLLIFKRNITKLFHPEKKSLFNITDPNVTRWIFQLRVGLSPLKCHTKKSHHFEDTPDDLCLCMLTAETTGHFILKLCAPMGIDKYISPRWFEYLYFYFFRCELLFFL